MTRAVEFWSEEIYRLLESMNDNILTLSEAQATSTSVFGEQSVIQRTPVAGWRFDYSVNPKIATAITATGGTVTTFESKAVLTTTTTSGSLAAVRSKKALRYTPGVGGTIRFTCVFDEPQTNNRQIIGVGDANNLDGLFFGYNTNRRFGFMRRRAGLEQWTYQEDWNGTLAFTPNYENGNVFQIAYQWLGYGGIVGYMEDPLSITLKRVNTIQYANSSPNTTILNPTLYVYAENRNIGAIAAPVIMQTPSAMAFSDGYQDDFVNPLDVFQNVEANATFNTQTTEHHILTLQNQTTFLGVENRIPVAIDDVLITRDSGTPVATFRVRKNATFGTTLTYTNVDVNHSPSRYSTTTTTVSGGDLLRTVPLSGVANYVAAFRKGELVLDAGETISISVVLSANNAVVVGTTFNFVEQF